MVSLVDFINSVSYTDNIQDVSTRSRTVGRKVTFDRRGGGRPTVPTAFGYGPGLLHHSVAEQLLLVHIQVTSITRLADRQTVTGAVVSQGGPGKQKHTTKFI